MIKLMKEFWQEEEGMGTVEVVLIIAVLVGIALIFKDAITKFITNSTDQIFKNANTEFGITGEEGGGDS